jgi:hypothetical protein
MGGGVGVVAFSVGGAPVRPSSCVATRRQHAEVERGSCRIGIGFQLDGGCSPVAAIERRVFDPAAKLLVAPQLAPDADPEITGIGVHEPRRYAARAAVAVNEANPVRAHLPRLLNDHRHRRPDDGGGMIAVQVDFHGRWGLRVSGHGATWTARGGRLPCCTSNYAMRVYTNVLPPPFDLELNTREVGGESGRSPSPG